MHPKPVDIHSTPSSLVPSLAEAQAALASERFETARRIALALDRNDPRVAVVLHDALSRLGDLPAAIAVLDAASATSDAATTFALAVRRLDDLFRAAAYAFYRTSREKDLGLTHDEVLTAMRPRRAAAARAMLDSIRTAEQADEARAALLRIVHDSERRAPSDLAALEELSRTWPAAKPAVVGKVVVALRGRLRFTDGQPAAATVTLVVEAPVARRPVDAVRTQVIGISIPECGELGSLAVPLAADGTFAISGELPPGSGALAVTVPAADGIQTRFIVRDLVVDGRPLAPVDLLVEPWASAPAATLADPLPEVVEHGGRRWRKQAVEALNNPFWSDLPRQDLHLAWALPPAGSAGLVWTSAEGGASLAHEVDRGGRVLCFTDLPRRSTRHLGWYHAEGAAPAAAPALLAVEAGGLTAVVDTGRSRFRIPWGAAVDGAAPLLAVMGPDRQWRGAGRWDLGGRAAPQRTTTVVSDGALECVVEIAYRFATGERCAFTLTFHAGEEYALVGEQGEALPGVAFILGLEDFRGGRGYLHWCGEGESVHWHDLTDADRELARLQESVPWWIPPAGFAWAATADGLARCDLVGVFTRRRGDWIDHAFAAIAGGPPAGGHELDWPYPEMVGSTISMITVASTAAGRLEARFPRFAGERHWGVLASDVLRGDGPTKELWAVRHKTSFPRLDELRGWRLDEADRVQRPCLIAERERLPAIRAGLAHPDVAAQWARLGDDRQEFHHELSRIACEALRFAVTGDPLTGWRLGRRLVQRVPAQARCLLLSRENGDVWSPVGGRTWAPQAEAYDAVLPSGALTADEEREVRAGLLLAGHMFRSPDLMNWRYGGRNANFESDRVEVVGGIGLCFPGNPDAEAFVAHSVERMHAALNAYCTPGSGKWYENPACYYLHSFKCRMSLACHLAERGLLDLAQVPRLDSFLGWLLQTLTPRLPASYDVMRDGCDHAAYAALPRIRRVAPVGDHAGIGGAVPDLAAVTAHWLKDSDPRLASALRWAWDQAGRDGGQGSASNQLIAQCGPADLAAETQVPEMLVSRRLEGFGAVFRGAMGTDAEFMLLAKLGPGGYRYHRTEGSFILVADGRPLVYDGGEAGEAWRHSAITYHDVRLPPSPGRIERFASLPGVDYAQGAHPVVLRPGDPVFLSDVCEHQLVAEAHRRARIARPAAARAWLWAKDEYVVVWDRLDVPADVLHHWNLQVMAHDEAGDPGTADGLRFRGRFGTDLQVLLPAGAGRPWSVEQVAMHEYRRTPEDSVAQRHLALTATGPTDWLAVLRPLRPGAAPLAATPLHALGRTVGARISGPGIDDHVVLGRTPVAITDGDWSLSGTAGACLRRPGAIRLVLLGAGRVALGDAMLESDGPAAELLLDGGAPTLRQDGEGVVVASVGGRTVG